MTDAQRLRDLSFAIEQNARELRAYAEMLMRSEVPDRDADRRIAGVLNAIAYDRGVAAGIAGRASAKSIEEASAALVSEVEGDDPSIPKDPPGRPTPPERPSTRAPKE